MRIVCPVCATAYNVPDPLVTPGRVVRCSRCNKEWAPVAGPAAPEPPPTPTEPPPAPVAQPVPPMDVRAIRGSAMDRLAAHPAWPHSSLPLRLAWVGSLALLVLAVMGAYVWRNDIVAVWPPSARAYAAFGLHPLGTPTHD